MVKIVGVMLTMAGLLAGTAASAEKVELSTVKCERLNQMSKENVSFLITWLLGYYTDEGAGESVDLDYIRETSAKISNFCIQNPNFRVLNVTEAVLGK